MKMIGAWLVTFGVLLMAGMAWGMEQGKPQEGPMLGAGNAPMMGAPDPHAGLSKGTGAGTVGGGVGGGDEAMLQRELEAFYLKQDRTVFEQKIDLDGFSRLAVQHKDQVKILDSWARQSLRTIRNRQSLDGKSAMYVALDMAIRPEAYLDKNIIYVQAVPVREGLTMFAEGKDEAARAAEAQRIMTTALVSPAFLSQPRVEQMLQQMGNDATKAQAVGKVFTARETFKSLGATLMMLPPKVHGTPWVHPVEVAGTGPGGATVSYGAAEDLKIKLAFKQLVTGWQENDVDVANAGIKALVEVVPELVPEEYPTETKRNVELWYSRSFNGTLVAFVYFLAMSLFLMVAVGVTKRVEKGALVMFGVALALHLTAMGVRWWLAGRIPIQNQFESVMGSAAGGCLIGLALETWKRNGIFGVAFSFVGFLAMTACLASPYVFGTDLGAGISPVAAILNDAWLYIHVNIVIASYALIFAAAVIGSIYLGIRLWHWINPIEPAYLYSDELPDTRTMLENARFEKTSKGTNVYVTLPEPSEKVIQARQEIAPILARRAAQLDVLDQANVVVLQMAFWFLGIGIICGAVWADHSWGRPWGWDPKETFALVTWIVYLIIVHVRFVTKMKGDWSAALAVVGCAVMLFNWIGVNFFLQGLHSYA